jgi:hypothetical protein
MTMNEHPETKRTKKELLQEIDLRRRSILKFSSVLAPLEQSIRELEKRLAFEQKVVDELTEKMKGCSDDE